MVSLLSLSFLLLSLACSIYTQNTTSSAPTANLGYVIYQGYADATKGINYFRGIRYAQPPLGNLRWRQPQPIEQSNNYTAGKVVQAATIAPACYQSLPKSLYSPGNLSYASTPQGQSEDCLYLDVLVPSKPGSSSLPVLLQIHGGGYTEGNAQSYPGDALVNASNGQLIYVSIQYRLGLFGFLGGSEIAADGERNAGLLDQRLAIEWVRKHIAPFGGDPSRITIWGGSAGGGSVTYQLIAGSAQDTPPFSAAIAEYPWWQPLLNDSTQDRQYHIALTLANCTDLNCLRGLSSQTLQFVNQADQNASYPGPGDGYGVFWYGPVVDGAFIRDLPDQEFKKGNFYKVPLIVDRDGYEGAVFSNETDLGTSQVYETADAMNLFPFAGPSFFSRLYQLYPASNFNSTFFQRQTWFGDFIISCPSYQMATAMTDYSTNASAVFKLVFYAGSQLHGATSPFLASTEPGFPGSGNQTLASIMASYWVSFTVTHDPNQLRAADTPAWPSYTSGGNGTAANGEGVGFDVLYITEADIAVQQDPDVSPQCDFFSSRGWQVRN